jgi:uncharacterized membrane protein
MNTTIRNPIEWGWDHLKQAAGTVGTAGHNIGHAHLDGAHLDGAAAAPRVQKIDAADIKEALMLGLEDFGAYRSDVVFLCVIYPIIGMLAVPLAVGANMLPLIFPLASGFALIGPLAAIGLYEMSRQREAGAEISWLTAADVIKRPAIGAVALLGLALIGLFALWMAVSWLIYLATLGPQPASSLISFASDVLTTPPGWAMIGIGIGVGFLFAVAALLISVVSFPLLIDRDVGVDTAVRTSIKAVRENPGAMALWGFIVAGALVLGSLPLFLGLVVVMPVLGHATWHLYRKVVA